jgi:putative endonuclease
VSASSRGRDGEDAAARHLAGLGWSLLARNWRAGAGEVDIVAQEGDCVVFVEVKAHADPGNLEWSVGPTKRRRIVSASRRWLAAHPESDSSYVRYDVILVREGSVEHIRNAFGG